MGSIKGAKRYIEGIVNEDIKHRGEGHVKLLVNVIMLDLLYMVADGIVLEEEQVSKQELEQFFQELEVKVEADTIRLYEKLVE